MEGVVSASGAVSAQALDPSNIEDVDIADVFYTQDSCNSKFRDGRALADLIGQLQRGEKDPLKDDFLVLNAVKSIVRGEAS